MEIKYREDGNFISFIVLKAAAMESGVFWDVMWLCGPFCLKKKKKITSDHLLT